MDISEFLRGFKEKQQQGAAALAESERQEVLRRKLNAEKVSHVLREIVFPKLVDAVKKIKAEGFDAQAETKGTTEGQFVVAVVLSTHRVKNITENSRFKLEYAGDDNTAVINVRIRVPSPDPHPYRDIGLFPFDSIISENVDTHIEQLVKMAFK